MDWASIFEPSIPVVESILRGSLIFLGLTVLLRITGQRESGSLALTDLLVVVLIAQAIGQGFAPGSTSITDGFIAVVTILAWSIVLDALAYRFAGIRRLLKPSKRPLVEDGRPNKHIMHREFLGREELEAQLRLQGIEDIAHVRVAYLEPNGMISAFRKDAGAAGETDHPAANPPPER